MHPLIKKENLSDASDGDFLLQQLQQIQWEFVC